MLCVTVALLLRIQEGVRGGIPFEGNGKHVKSDTQLAFTLGRRSRLWALSVIVFGGLFVLGIIHRLFQLSGDVFDARPVD